MLKSFLSALGLRNEPPTARQEPPFVDRCAAALANFPFEIVETTGENALAKWEELKTAGRGVPVIVGDDVDNILRPFYPGEYATLTPVSEQLAAADAIRIPEDLWLEDDDAELGEWPTDVPEPEAFSAALDPGTRAAFPRVYIVLIPTDDPTTIPAHLSLGQFQRLSARARPCRCPSNLAGSLRGGTRGPGPRQRWRCGWPEGRQRGKKRSNWRAFTTPIAVNSRTTE